jgi:hypothetical protein
LLALLEGGIQDAKAEMNLYMDVGITIPKNLWDRGKAMGHQTKLLEECSAQNRGLKEGIRQTLDADVESLIFEKAG